MIINDLHRFGVAANPPKANPPLSLDPDTVLTFPVSPQRFQAVRRRDAQVCEILRRVEHDEFSQGRTLNVRREPSGKLPPEDPFGLFRRKRPDHVKK
jgi:hypothetical protein